MATPTTALAGAAATSAPSAKRLLVIDTDVGCDDAVALLLAARDPNTKLVAITTVFGNVNLKQATGACQTEGEGQK